MPCYKPLEGWRSRHLNSSGKRPIVFNKNQGYEDLPVTIGCGRCVGCRLERSRQWAIRCVHEASLHDDNIFVTLTYNQDNQPHHGSLVKQHFQKFMKRLRYHTGKKIRYYACGEYGDNTDRPHYHAILFGLDFDDKTLYSVRNEVPLFTSQTLEDIWGKGFCTIGAVNFETAAYTARYIMKKINGEEAEEHYKSMCPITGELNTIEPEFTLMSRKPGIATEWFKKYKDDVFPEDEIVINGRVMKPPRFYDGLYETEEQEYRQMKRERIRASKRDSENQTPERLAVREKVKLAQTKQLSRTI